MRYRNPCGSVIEKCKHFSATLVLHTFRAVEGTFTRVQNVVEASELRCFGEGGFSLVPDFIGTHALWTPAASALRLSNENKRVCFRCIRLASFSGRVEKLKGVPHFVGRTIFWGQSTALTLAAHLPEPSLATQVLSLI